MEQSTTHMARAGALGQLIAWTGTISKWMAVTMVLLQFAVVVARYLFDAGSVMAQEAILYLFGTMFMLAMADALASDRHVRVDMLYHTFSARRRRIIDALGILFFLLPLCIFMFWASKDYVLNSWTALEGSREASGLPGVFLFKTVIPIALLLLILHALSILKRCVLPKGSQNG
ncbi:TRAP transporter small permease subunit (plasmid) [Leisingera sp. S132]|uniref:TRAP transporter small permease subunit n=1 Tax=Leisingera sp. S132 TaxID=2867016 RepID=UPI00147A9EB7|nr:TRAP transporter small permease subunit [Leisingera sp. S132]UWQ81497.1 TRAP transporter small permease subunit [Leisingera sp. S132]